MKLYQRIYVEVDVLHDTRYGLLMEKWPWLVSKFDFSHYSTRVVDSWLAHLGVSPEDWLKAWEERSVETLKQTPPTVLLYELVRELRQKYAAVTLGSPLHPPELIVNTWPYKYSKEELKVYKEVLDSFYGDVTVAVELIYKSPEELTPSFMRDNFEAGFMYDWRKWLGIHLETLGKNPMPGFVLNGPALLDIKSAAEVADQIVEDKINPFTEAKDFIAEMITLDLEDSGLFSLRLPSHDQT